MPSFNERFRSSRPFRIAITVLLPFALVALVLATIVILRWVASHHLVGQSGTATPVVASTSAPAPAPPVPSAEQVAAAPHPAVPASDNPPVTETGKNVVIDEPVAPLPTDEPPPPRAAPREEVALVPVAAPPAAEKAKSDSAAPAPAEMTAQREPPQPAPAPLKTGLPDWQRLAVAPMPAAGRPMIAIIIDDMGLDRRRSQRVIDLPGPLTISFMSYAEDMARQEAEARAHGHEIMMHVPMEPLDGKFDPGPGALTERLSPAEIRKTFDSDLAKFGGYVGINNHMGSKFTAYTPGMEVVMEDLRERGLLFIDSLTTDKSVGLAMARRYGVPSAGRNVFLDNAGDLISVDYELEQLETVARSKGNAIAIGHPRDATIEALAAWLPKLKSKGFVLVPVTQIVRARMETASQTAQTSR